MIPNYTPPRLLLQGKLEVVPDATPPRTAALMVGASYDVQRFGKQNVPVQTFLDTGGTFQYLRVNAAGAQEEKDATWEVDLPSVRIRGVDLEALYANLPDSGDAQDRIYLDSLSTPNIIRIGSTASHRNFKGGTLATNLRGAPVQVGQIVRITHAGKSYRRVVTGLKGVALDPTYGSNAAADDETLANSSANPTTEGASSVSVTQQLNGAAGWSASITSGSFSGYATGARVGNKAGDDFIIEVLPGAATVRITSVGGTIPETTENISIVADDVVVPNVGGFTLTFAHDTLSAWTAGWKFRVRVLAIYERLTTSQLILSTGDTYTGARNTTYVLQVVASNTAANLAAGAVLKITDINGVDEPEEVTITNDATEFLIGTKGLAGRIDLASVAVDQQFLRVGDIYTVSAVASTESTVEFDRLVLDAAAIDIADHLLATPLEDVSILSVFNSYIASDYADGGVAWEAAADEVTVNAGLGLNDTTRDAGYQWVPFLDQVGSLVIEYRALKPALLGESYALYSSNAEVIDGLGDITPENELAYAVSCALQGSAGRAVYAIRTAGIEAADFTAALRKLESTDEFYALSVVTDDQAVRLAARQHVLAQSSAEIQNFRKLYVGTDNPGAYKVLDRNAENNAYLATVTSNGSGFLLMTCTDADVDFRLLNLRDQDYVKFLTSGASYEIASVVSRNELLFKTGPDAAITPAEAFEIWKANTPENQADKIREISRALASELVAHVWAPNGTALQSDGTTAVVSNKFVAAYVAGARSALEAQYGLTRTEIPLVTAIPEAYTLYGPTLLNTIAADGTMVITQDAPGGEVYIRHQLTTQTAGGILFREDNIIMILHTLLFQVKDAWRKLPGKINVSRRRLALLDGQFRSILENAKKVPDGDQTAEPLIQDFENAVVQRDALMADWFDISADIFVAVPGNTIRVTLTGRIQDAEALTNAA